MINDRFQGDPKLILTDDGADILYSGGNPVMDAGLENLAQISLLTAPGWWGNSLLDDDDQKLGSNFEEVANGILNLQLLNDISQAAEAALDNPAFGKVTSTVTNPADSTIKIENLIEPPGQDIETIILTRNGINWQNQAIDPAYLRI